MKQVRQFPAATVTKKAERAIRKGHPWVFEDEVIRIDDNLENGCIIDVFSEKGSWLGAGLLSEKSKIRVRILSQNANESFSDAFWIRRVNYALEYRRTVMGEYFPGCCRLIFGEADGIPGLTIDRYNDLVVSEVLSYGIEKKKDVIYKALVDYFKNSGNPIVGIYERNEGQLRDKEGLEKYKGWYESSFISKPTSCITEIVENGIKYTVDIENGQKTGFFLDQKFNRLAVSKLAKGRKVLDCCTHTGSFALNAAYGGADHVTAVDVSELAIETARHYASINGLSDKMDFVCADIFDLLPKLCEDHSDYDFIILDPPAFTKNRKTVRDASRGYKEINYRAMKLLPRGGLLATASCSHFMTDELFREMLKEAAADANVQLKLIESRRQSPDHPVLLNVPDNDYLKFYLFQIV